MKIEKIKDSRLHGVDKHFTVETMFSILDTQLKQFKIDVYKRQALELTMTPNYKTLL